MAFCGFASLELMEATHIHTEHIPTCTHLHVLPHTHAHTSIHNHESEKLTTARRRTEVSLVQEVGSEIWRQL